jgi:hypothetical protein
MLRSSVFRAVAHCFRTLSLVVFDVVRQVFLVARSHSTSAAENLFLRKQLALFQERKAKPRRADDSTRWIMASLSRMFPWRDALVNVKPDTLIRWHRKGFRLSWRWKSKLRGRPRLAKDLRQLIREMAAEAFHLGGEPEANKLGGEYPIMLSTTKNARVRDDLPHLHAVCTAYSSTLEYPSEPKEQGNSPKHDSANLALPGRHLYVRTVACRRNLLYG